VPENYKQGTEAFSTSDAVISQGVFSCYDYALRIFGCANNNKPLKDPLDITHHGEGFNDEQPKSNQPNCLPIDNSDITSLSAIKATSWQKLIDNAIASKNVIRPKTDPLDLKNYTPSSVIKADNYK
jgi:hypothetical protein